MSKSIQTAHGNLISYSCLPWDLCSQFQSDQAVFTAEVSGGDGYSEERSVQSGHAPKQASYVPPAWPSQSTCMYAHLCKMLFNPAQLFKVCTSYCCLFYYAVYLFMVTLMEKYLLGNVLDEQQEPLLFQIQTQSHTDDDHNGTVKIFFVSFYFQWH